MRKILLMMLILSLLTPCVFSAAEIYIMPKDGAFGVYLGSDKYSGGEKYSGETLESIDAGSDYYVEDMIVATVTIGEIPVGTPLPKVNFSVDCSEGLYFISQQGEGSRRPFELKVIPKIRATYVQERWLQDDIYKDDDNDSHAKYAETITLSDGAHASRDIQFLEYPEDQSDTWRPGDEFYFYDLAYYVLIFDVILVLPFESITSTGTLTTDSGVYQLVQADDYTALVTLNVSYNDLAQSVTIPFSGYFSLNETVKREGSANLYVSPTSAASNLSIENDWGRTKTVASVNFLASYSQDTNSDYRIFLSASNDPTTRSQYGFELVHEDVTPLQPHTSNNSIGYTLELSGVSGNYTPTSPVEFEGYACIEGNAIVDENGEQSVKIDSNTIYEAFRANDYLSGIYDDNGNPRYIPTVTYEYEGDINVIIDEPVDINAMMPGRYYSDIYVHVVDLGA